MKRFAILLLAFSLGACGGSGDETAATANEEKASEEFSISESGVKTKNVEGFGGVIAQSYEDSEEWWAPYKEPHEDAPNVIIFLLDDVGFAQVGSFGGLIKTPNIDALAAGGLRYNNFHTTALCSPSRATLMAGRNPHSIGLGSHALTAMGFPGYNAIMPESAKSVANYLGEEGYINYALGKWDHTPLYEVSQTGPFDRWPSGEGFHHAYTFMAADVHQFVPVMWNDHTPEPYRKSIHLDQDLANRAIEWITGHKSLKPDLPFMMLWASGSMHSPHHAPESHIDKYKGKFDMGWDKAREQILEQQIAAGVVPEGTKLTERIDAIPAWDSLSPEEQSLYARQMEVFAGQMEWVDMQIGRVVESLRRIGELDNTLIFVTVPLAKVAWPAHSTRPTSSTACKRRWRPTCVPSRTGVAKIPTRITTRAGQWPVIRRSATSNKASTAADRPTRSWCTGRTASKPRAKSAASTTTSPISPRPSWRRPASRYLRSTTASSSNRWMAPR